MAIDPRLMMVDYVGGLSRAGESLGQGIQGYRMKQTQDLAGRALMGDPSAMAGLAERDPAMAAQVQQQQAASAAQQRQLQFQQQQQQLDYARAFSEAQDKFGPRLAKFTNFQDAQKEHERLMRTDPLYRMANQGGTLPDGTEVPPDTEFTNEDFLNLRAGYGGGFGDMDFPDVVRLYEENPVVEDMLKAKNSARTIGNAYERLKQDPTDQAAQFNIAKAAIQMIESGVVRPEEFSAAAGFAFQPGMTAKDVLEVAKGGLTFDQATNLARMGTGAYNAKVENVKELQNSLVEAGLGAHAPDRVFATARAEPISIEIPSAPAEKPADASPVSYTDPDTGKPYTFPSQQALDKYLSLKGGQ